MPWTRHDPKWGFHNTKYDDYQKGVHALHFKCHYHADERLLPFCQSWLDRMLVFSRIMDLNYVKGNST